VNIRQSLLLISPIATLSAVVEVAIIEDVEFFGVIHLIDEIESRFLRIYFGKKGWGIGRFLAGRPGG
jgi:hypothetical protein